jgi:hypothetical protein
MEDILYLLLKGDLRRALLLLEAEIAYREARGQRLDCQDLTRVGDFPPG